VRVLVTIKCDVYISRSGMLADSSKTEYFIIHNSTVVCSKRNGNKDTFSNNCQIRLHQ